MLEPNKQFLESSNFSGLSIYLVRDKNQTIHEGLKMFYNILFC